MSIDFPQSNKMMTEAPDKKVFHFSGDGIWRNKAILAETREEAEKIWHSVKELINPEKPHVEVDTTEAIAQSTPAPAPEIEGGVVE